MDSTRERVRAARRGLDDLDRLVADSTLNDRAIDLIRSRSARSVSSYLSRDGEPDLAATHRWCAANAVAVAVPVMGEDRTLEFRRLGTGSLKENRSGILEPATGVAVELVSLDIVFVPLVLFDEDANRAGRGGGWYDKALASRREAQLLAGVAYDLQRVERVPTHSGDVPLDVVLTDLEVYHRPSR